MQIPSSTDYLFSLHVVIHCHRKQMQSLVITISMVVDQYGESQIQLRVTASRAVRQ